MGDPSRMERQRDKGIISNSQNRVNLLLNEERPKLTPEIALKELQDKMAHE